MAEEVVGAFANQVFSLSEYVTTTLDLPAAAGIILLVVFFALIIVGISLFIWKFYHIISKRDFLKLNLQQYNYTGHPILKKLSASALYLLEYIIILPLLILIWFGALSVIFILLAEEQSVITTLLITAALVAATRILAYYNPDMSEEVAKLLPLVSLATFLLSPQVFSIERIATPFRQIPSMEGTLLFFLLAIFLVEIALRFLYTIGNALGENED